MTIDRVKEIINDAFGVYYSEYGGCEDYNVHEVNEAHNMVINVLDEIEKYKQAIEKLKHKVIYIHMTDEEKAELQTVVGSYPAALQTCDESLVMTREEVPFDFELYEAGLMSIPKEMIKILDKIRSEVEKLKFADDLHNDFVNVHNLVIEVILNIIDKYRTEREITT